MRPFRPALSTLAPIALGLLAASCAKPAQETPATLASSSMPAPGVAEPAETAAARPEGAREVRQSNDLFEFAYSYPAAAGAVPDLKAQLDAELDRQKAELVKNAEEQRAERREAGFPYHPLGNWTEWKVVTDLPGWLSLSARFSDYQGGAHPNHGFATLLWDRQANERRDPIDLFISKQALSQAIRKDFCAALDRERGKRRGEPVRPGSTAEFDRCIDPAESTVILGSSSGRAFDRVGVLVAPYEAGPYAEGDYEVTLPVTQAVLAAVKPGYRAAFATGR